MRRRRKPVYPDSRHAARAAAARSVHLPVPAQPAAGPQEAHIRRETKGQGGKTITVVRNLQLTPAVRSRTESSRSRVASVILQEMGYRTKFTGG